MTTLHAKYARTMTPLYSWLVDNCTHGFWLFGSATLGNERLAVALRCARCGLARTWIRSALALEVA